MRLRSLQCNLTPSLHYYFIFTPQHPPPPPPHPQYAILSPSVVTWEPNNLRIQLQNTFRATKAARESTAFIHIFYPPKDKTLNKAKTNSGYKHNKQASHGILNLTVCMLQHTSSDCDGYKIRRDLKRLS